MGQVFSRPNSGTEDLSGGSGSAESSRKKRAANSDESEAGQKKRKKITKLDTAKYIHKRLFIDGAKSDITVCALGRTWRLHRLYLEQCKFFDSLFRGQWKDSNDPVLHLDIVDPNITAEGLHMVLESLYHDEIEIDLENVVSLIASASLLSLDSVMERCAELCAESLNDERVVLFHTLAGQYGLQDLSEKCFEYLKWNFWRLSKKPAILSTVSHAIMAKLISTPDLLVLEGEMDLYETVKTWIFLQTVPVVPEDNQMQTEMEKFYSTLSVSDRNSLYYTFANVLCHIRVGHIVSSVKTVISLRKDALVPDNIIDKVLADQWLLLLFNEEMKQPLEISEEVFYRHARRLGRILDTNAKCWRWYGFYFGLDLLMNFNQGTITLKRNCLSQLPPWSTSLKIELRVHYRIVVGNAQGKYIFDSQKQCCELRIDQSIVVAHLLPTPEEFPLNVHFFYMSALPGKRVVDYWKQYLQPHEFQTNNGSAAAENCVIAFHS